MPRRYLHMEWGIIRLEFAITVFTEVSLDATVKASLYDIIRVAVLTGYLDYFLSHGLTPSGCSFQVFSQALDT